jgi:prepilin-type N-terminal cleavage/methylation domain-containing protein
VIQKKNGFTLLELVCAMAIIVVMSAAIVPVGRKMMRSAETARERVQARSLWTALQLYLQEEHRQGELRSYILLEELAEERPDSEMNPLNQYLQGNVSGNAVIQGLTLNKDHSEVTELIYRTDQWTVKVSHDSIVIQPFNEF